MVSESQKLFKKKNCRCYSPGPVGPRWSLVVDDKDNAIRVKNLYLYTRDDWLLVSNYNAVKHSLGVHKMEPENVKDFNTWIKEHCDNDSCKAGELIEPDVYQGGYKNHVNITPSKLTHATKTKA
ncbi:hypothetical protein AMATHDRAFT_65196, partial [Amanita thiersii Skay4041]